MILRKIKNITLFGGILGFWLVMNGLLIQKHFLQISTVQAPYEVLPIDLDIREEYNAILMDNQRIGFNYTSLQKKKDDPDGNFELRHKTYLAFLFLGQQREMLTRGTATLDPRLNLKEFTVRISSGDQWTQMTGQTAKDNLNMVIESSEGEPVRKIIPLQGPVLFTEGICFMWTPENLKVGKKGSLAAWNPLMANFQTVHFHVFGKTRIDFAGTPTEVYEIHMDSGDGLETRTWVNPEGIVLKEEGFTGMTQIKEEGWQIYDDLRNNKSRLDLPNLFSIPSNKILEDPANLNSLKVTVTLPSGERTIALKKPNLQDFAGLTLPVPAETASPFVRYLESSAWVESQDAEIVKKSKEIIGDSPSALEASLRLMRWVHENISPVPSLSLPKSKQILVSKKGDCNEYTVLFTALARAAGIPTRMIAGLVYQNGRFFYHAWPEVFLGKWIGIDPTFGQAPVDVTHIPLIEGGVEEQTALANQIGRIKIKILETPGETS